MRKVLILVIFSVFIIIVINLKNFTNIIDVDEVKIKLSKFYFFEKKITRISVVNNNNTSKNYLSPIKEAKKYLLDELQSGRKLNFYSMISQRFKL